ncbi:MAG: DUF308 domain-containing protein [Lachnospiraceae bacterium]|nr:DUF308 domain-containing protein [Lachnospiraceae bacterium]MBQ1609054.1 DUF308 domain-containing protein [Lachnospiraceae bacterium]MBQ1640293.1 DUF308 domain-containing protein [Lachnospiraceae bacterium]MBQ2578164.1 DUF308 domain-containing protein [Lachnospiraceae bacterium]MBQ5386466.1 DUF308 domain-containing protein [Lachnospiraceae bacterium]
MFEKLKKIRLHVSLSALLTVVLGVVIMLNPTSTVLLIAKAVGTIILIVGAVMILGGLFDSDGTRMGGIAVGAIIAIIGAWVLMSPEKAAAIIPAVVGVIMILQGIENAELAFSAKKARGRHWGMNLLVAAANIAFGVLCITTGLGVVSIGMMFVGGMLVFNGLSSMVVVHRVNSAERQAIIDVEARVTDEDDYI